MRSKTKTDSTRRWYNKLPFASYPPCVFSLLFGLLDSLSLPRLWHWTHLDRWPTRNSMESWLEEDLGCAAHWKIEGWGLANAFGDDSREWVELAARFKIGELWVRESFVCDQWGSVVSRREQTFHFFRRVCQCYLSLYWRPLRSAYWRHTSETNKNVNLSGKCDWSPSELQFRMSCRALRRTWSRARTVRDIWTDHLLSWWGVALLDDIGWESRWTGRAAVRDKSIGDHTDWFSKDGREWRSATTVFCTWWFLCFNRYLIKARRHHLWSFHQSLMGHLQLVIK